jgi:hypothetical protein
VAQHVANSLRAGTLADHERSAGVAQIVVTEIPQLAWQRSLDCWTEVAEVELRVPLRHRRVGLARKHVVVRRLASALPSKKISQEGRHSDGSSLAVLRTNRQQLAGTLADAGLDGHLSLERIDVTNLQGSALTRPRSGAGAKQHQCPEPWGNGVGEGEDLLCVQVQLLLVWCRTEARQAFRQSLPEYGR